MEKLCHPYHLVTVSPWPFLTGVSVLSIIVGLISMFSFFSMSLLYKSFFFLILVIYMWWRDVVRESTFQGFHTSNVVSGLMFGMILFIVSEIFFFFSFFWTFFHSSLSPSVDLGIMWPPSGIFTLNAFQVPLLNTVILLSSGISVTWAHQSFLFNNFLVCKRSLLITWLLGVYFLFLQMVEYSSAGFNISDSVFGSIFFMSTGFHGFHVVVGVTFLFIMWVRVTKLHFSEGHHFGFECAAWYWHFVDVVWLFLFSVVYWWGC